MSSTVWIERDPEGRPYYVKRKEKPSTREQVAEFFLTLRRRPNPLGRVFRRDHIVVPAGVREPPVLDPSRPSSRKNPDADSIPKINKHNMNPPFDTTNNTSQPPSTYPVPSFNMVGPSNSFPFLPTSNDSNQPNQDNQNDQGAMIRGVVRPAQYGAPLYQPMWPTTPGLHQMFPLPNPAAAFQAHPVMPYPGPGPMPFPALGSINLRPAPTIPQALSPEVMKYKCHVCGKVRSAGYHHDHPLLPGEFPGKTICRKCKEKTTDSEEESTDSYEVARASRKESRPRGGSRATSRKTGRSRSHITTRRSAARYTEHSSPSPSSSEGELHRRGSYRGHSPSRNIRTVHYGDTLAPRELSRRIRTIYIDDDRDYRREDNHWYGERSSDGSYNRRNVYRPASPIPHTIHRQRSDPMVRIRDEGGLREHVDYPDLYDESPAYYSPRPLSRGAPHQPRIVTVVEHASHPDQFDSEFQHQYDDDDDGVKYPGRIRSVSARSRGRSASQHNRYDGGASEEVITGPSSTTHLALPGPPATVQHVRHSSLPVTTRSSSRPRYAVQMSSRYNGRNGEGIRNGDDYDWYDDHGMRVRVREI